MLAQRGGSLLVSAATSFDKLDTAICGLAELVDGKFQRQFGEDKFAALPKQCRACPELRFCHGGCPKDRLIPAEGGKLNWLCEGYQRFFRETAPYFSAMAQALRQTPC